MVKNLSAKAGDIRDAGSIPVSGRAPWQPTPVFLPWRIPWAEDPGGLQSIGSRRVGHGWSDLACTHTFLGHSSDLANFMGEPSVIS